MLYRNKKFKIEGNDKVYLHLTDLKEDLGLVKTDTVFDYLKRNNLKLYQRDDIINYWHVVYYAKAHIGI